MSPGRSIAARWAAGVLVRNTSRLYCLPLSPIAASLVTGDGADCTKNRLVLCGLPTVEIASRPSLNHAQRIEDLMKFAEQAAVLVLAY